MNRIRYFSTLVELRHVRKASELLNINPASLSKAIKLLEHEVGFKLIVPAGRGIEITDRGLQFYRQSHRLVQEYMHFVANAKISERDLDIPIRIGSMEVFTTYFLSRFIETEKTRQRMHVRYLTPGRMENALKQREIDMGLTYIRLAEDELDYLRIGKFSMQIYGLKSFATQPFASLPFAVPINGVNTPSISLKSLDGWPNDDFPRQIKYEFELLETAVQSAALGQAVVYCPDFVIGFYNRLVQTSYKLEALPFPYGFKHKNLSIYAVKRKNDEETILVRKFGKFARSLSSDYPSSQ